MCLISVSQGCPFPSSLIRERERERERERAGFGGGAVIFDLPSLTFMDCQHLHYPVCDLCSKKEHLGNSLLYVSLGTEFPS